MCRTPNRLDDGTEVACRKCWQCKRNRVNDLVGRCIAESKFSKKTYAVTLTYANHAGVNAVTLVYKDVQDMMKRLRKRYKVRYIVAGEYGTAKGRAHWHIILFFKDKDPATEVDEDGNPEIIMEKRVHWKYWGTAIGKDENNKTIYDYKGYCYFQQPDWKGFQYVLKYVLKDSDLDSADSHLAMSKKPPLGYEFFNELAKTHVEQAVIPRSYKYKVGGVKKDNGTEKVFMMQGKTRENFMNAIKDGWTQKYGKEPQSEFYDEWDEKNYSVEYTDEELVKRLHHKDVMYYEPWVQMGTDEDQGTWIEANYYGNEIVIHGKKDETWIYEDGEWREDRENAAEIIGLSEIKRIRTFEEAQREEIEQLAQLHEKQRRLAEQYQ
jgi:hypothetical protein